MSSSENQIELLLHACGQKLLTDALCPFSNRVCASFRLPPECEGFLSMIRPNGRLVKVSDYSTPKVSDDAAGATAPAAKMPVVEAEPQAQPFAFTFRDDDSLHLFTPLRSNADLVKLVVGQRSVVFQNASVARAWWAQLFFALASYRVADTRKLVIGWRLPDWLHSAIGELAASTDVGAKLGRPRVIELLADVGVHDECTFYSLAGLFPELELRNRFIPRTVRDALDLLLQPHRPVEIMSLWAVMLSHKLVAECGGSMRSALELSFEALRLRMAVEDDGRQELLEATLKQEGCVLAQSHPALVEVLGKPVRQTYADEFGAIIEQFRSAWASNEPLSRSTRILDDMCRVIGLDDQTELRDFNAACKTILRRQELSHHMRNFVVGNTAVDVNSDLRMQKLSRAEIVARFRASNRLLDVIQALTFFREDDVIVLHQMPYEFHASMSRYLQRTMTSLPCVEMHQVFITALAPGVALDAAGSVGMVASLSAWSHLYTLQMTDFLTCRNPTVKRNRHADVFELMRSLLCGDDYTVMMEFSNVLISYISDSATPNSTFVSRKTIDCPTFPINHRAHYLRYLFHLLYSLFPMPTTTSPEFGYATVMPRLTPEQREERDNYIRQGGGDIFVQNKRALDWMWERFPFLRPENIDAHHREVQRRNEAHLDKHIHRLDSDRFGAHFELSASRVHPNDCIFDKETNAWIGLKKTPTIDATGDAMVLPHFYYGILSYLSVGTIVERWVHSSVVAELRDALFDMLPLHDEEYNNFKPGNLCFLRDSEDYQFYVYIYCWTLTVLQGDPQWVCLEPMQYERWRRLMFWMPGTFFIPRKKIIQNDPDQFNNNWPMPRLPEDEAKLPFFVLWYQLCADNLFSVELRRRMFFCTRLDEPIMFPTRQGAQSKCSRALSDSAWGPLAHRTSLYGDGQYDDGDDDIDLDGYEDEEGVDYGDDVAITDIPPSSSSSTQQTPSYASMFESHYCQYIMDASKRRPPINYGLPHGCCSLVPRFIRTSPVLRNCTLEPISMLVMILRDGAFCPVPRQTLEPVPSLESGFVPGYPFRVTLPSVRRNMTFADACVIASSHDQHRFNSFSWRLRGLWRFTARGRPNDSYYRAIENGPVPYSKAARTMAECEAHAATLAAQVGLGLPMMYLKNARVGRLGFECSMVANFTLAHFMTSETEMLVKDDQVVRFLASFSYDEFVQLSETVQGFVGRKLLVGPPKKEKISKAAKAAAAAAAAPMEQLKTGQKRPASSMK